MRSKAAAGTGPVVPVLAWPPRPARRLAGIPAGQLVCWQCGLLLALLAVNAPVAQAIGLGTAAATVVAATAWRPRGRWAHEWAWLWLRYRARRRRVRAAAAQPSPEQALLGLAARAADIDTLTVDGCEAALITHDHGCTVVLALGPGGGWHPDPSLPMSLTPRHEPGEPPVSVQLIVHTTPATLTGAPTDAWLAVRALRDGHDTEAGLRSAVAKAVRQVSRRLRQDRWDARPLDRAALGRALHTLTRLDLAGPAPASAEGWRVWWTRDVPQESLRVRGWHGLPARLPVDLVDAVLDSGCVYTLSVAARQVRAPSGAAGVGGEALAVELVLRLVERDPTALDAAARHLCERLLTAGAEVERLDGRQLPALAATLPLGGFLPGCTRSATVTRLRVPLLSPQPAPAPAVIRAPAVAAGPATARVRPVVTARVSPVITARAAVVTPAQPPAVPSVGPPPGHHAWPTGLVVPFVAAGRGVGTSTTAAAVAQALARSGLPAPPLLAGDGVSAAHLAATLDDLRRGHPVTLVDLGVGAGHETARAAVAASTGIVVVTSPGPRSGPAGQASLDLIHRVRPELLPRAVVAIVCRSTREYRRVAREVAADTSAATAQITPVPPDPALRATDRLDLGRLRAPTRQAYHRIAMALTRDASGQFVLATAGLLAGAGSPA